VRSQLRHGAGVLACCAVLHDGEVRASTHFFSCSSMRSIWRGLSLSVGFLLGSLKTDFSQVGAWQHICVSRSKQKQGGRGGKLPHYAALGCPHSHAALKPVWTRGELTQTTSTTQTDLQAPAPPRRLHLTTHTSHQLLPMCSTLLYVSATETLACAVCKLHCSRHIMTVHRGLGWLHVHRMCAHSHTPFTCTSSAS